MSVRAKCEAITAGAVTATLSGVDTGTDMTAAQAATIVTDLTNLAARVNSIITALEDKKLVKPN